MDHGDTPRTLPANCRARSGHIKGRAKLSVIAQAIEKHGFE
jgi:hypothetical protein